MGKSGAPIFPHHDDFLARENGLQYVYKQRAEEQKKEAAFVKQCVIEIQKDHGIPAEGFIVEGYVTKEIKKKVEVHMIDLVIAGHQKRIFYMNFLPLTRKKIL